MESEQGGCARQENVVEKRGGMCYDNGDPVKKTETKENDHMFENGTFAVAGEDGKPVRCEVLFTYDCEPQPWPLEDEAEYQIVRGCFEELKAKLMEQANEQTAEPQAEA